MKIQYTHNREMFRAMCKAQARHTRFHKTLFVFFWGIVILNLGTSTYFISNAWGSSIAPQLFANAGIAIALLIFRYVFVPWYQMHFYKLQNLEGSIITFKASDDHISVSNKDGKTTYKLTGLERIDRESDCIIFWTSKIIGITLPISAMKPEQYQELKQLTAGKVKDSEL